MDHRANKYFTLDDEEEEHDKKRQKEKSINSGQNYRVSRNNEKAEKEIREKQASRFNNVEPREEYKGDSNSRTRVGLPV